MRGRAQLIGVAFTLLSISGCSDSTEPLPTPAMEVSLASNSISVPRGQTKTFPITVTRTGGFTGTVTVSVTGLPTGLSAGCNPSTILGSTATLTVTADPAQAIGAFQANVHATGAGVTAQNFIVTINVTSS